MHRYLSKRLHDPGSNRALCPAPPPLPAHAIFLSPRETQLQWLQGTLKEAQAAGQRVILLSHVPVCPGSAQDSTLLWNYDKVRGQWRRVSVGGCVRASGRMLYVVESLGCE